MHTQKNLKVLDLGSGWGCFQSWQFAKYGFDVVAVELCPEFVFASDKIAGDAGFERIIADCSVLPFKDSSFDILLLKELIHHVSDPMDLLYESEELHVPMDRS